MNLTNIAVIESIVEQHAEEAAFLWILRDAAVQASHYSLNDMADLDKRVGWIGDWGHGDWGQTLIIIIKPDNSDKTL